MSHIIVLGDTNVGNVEYFKYMKDVMFIKGSGFQPGGCKIIKGVKKEGLKV